MDFVVTFVFWLLFATLYLGPSIVAVCRNHYRTPQIVGINVLLGWTIVGMFWAFAWALSSTRPPSEDDDTKLPTDFAERLFHNRNIIRQPDGGAVIYPGLLAEEAYWLGASEFRTYLKMRANEARRNFPRALIIMIGATACYFAFRQWIGPEQGTAPAILSTITIALSVTAWDLVFRPRRQFLAAFPKAPKTHDPIRHDRKVLAGLVAFEPLICTGGSVLCFGLIASFGFSLWHENQYALLRSQDVAILMLGFAILCVGGLFYGHLCWHHLLFFIKHHRTANQADLDNLGNGVQAPRRNAGLMRPSPRAADAAGDIKRPARSLAAALRLGPRQG